MNNDKKSRKYRRRSKKRCGEKDEAVWTALDRVRK